MKKIIYAFIAFGVIACQQKSAQLSEKELKEIVHAQNEKLESLFMAGDVEKLSQFYTKDAKLSGDGNNEVFIGREAIRGFWNEALKDAKLVDMNTETLSIGSSGDLIYETGKVANKISVGDSVYTFKAKYVNIWKKEDGEYKLDVDSWIDIQ